MRVHILSCLSFRSHCFTYPVRIFSRGIKASGLDVHIFTDIDHPSLLKCDVFMVVSDAFDPENFNKKPHELKVWLEQCREKVDTIIWCDITDSTGTIVQEILSSVNLYLKKQLLKDRSLYTLPFYEGRHHLDYFHKSSAAELDKLNKGDQPIVPGLEPWQIDKLAISWNLGLGDYNHLFGHREFRARWTIAGGFAKKIRDASSPDRPIQATYRVSKNYPSPAVTFHRQTILKIIEKIAQEGKYSLRYQGVLGYVRYIQEMARSQVVISPFGWGEICWRDFEGLLCGGLLFKPDMSHLETFPHYFEEDVTYIAHTWDLVDFESKLLLLMDAPEKYRSIAQAGQDRYMTSIGSDGGKAFINHFESTLKQAIKP